MSSGCIVFPVNFLEEEGNVRALCSRRVVLSFKCLIVTFITITMKQSLAVRCLIVELPPTGCFKKREIMPVKMRQKVLQKINTVQSSVIQWQTGE